MSRIIFVTHAAMGHFNPLFSIASELKVGGHDVGFLIPAPRLPFSAGPILGSAKGIFDRLDSAGIPGDSLTPSIRMALKAVLLSRKKGTEEIESALDLFTMGLGAFTSQLLERFRKAKPGAVVTDFSFLASGLASQAFGLPFVTIYHSGLPFPGKDVPPFGSGMPIEPGAGVKYPELEKRMLTAERLLEKRLRKVRARFEIPSAERTSLRSPYSPWLNLITSHERTEAPRTGLGDRTFFVGPCTSGRTLPREQFPFDRLEKGKFKIYVSLGTFFNDRPDVFLRILGALDDPEYQVIVSAGAAFRKLPANLIPRNALVFPSVPQVALLPKVDLVIGHGGNNSTNEALAAGKPLIVMPVGGEQCDNAERVSYLGAGSRVEMDGFTKTGLREKVAAMRENPSFRKNASDCSAHLAETCGSSTAACLIDWVAKNQSPALRPAFFPTTITRSNLETLMNSLSPIQGG